MGKISLEQEDKLNKIIEVSKSIITIYVALLCEEVTNGTDTCAYIDSMKKLEEARKIEKSLYRQLGTNPYEINDLIEFFTYTEKSIVERENNVEAAINIPGYNELYYRRIMNKLSSLFVNNSQTYRSYLIKEHYVYNGDDVEDYIITQSFETAIEQDFERSFYYFLTEGIKESDSSKEIDCLSTTKYNLAYISSSIEEKMINDFKVKACELYFCSPLVQEFYGMGDNASKGILLDHVDTYFNDALNNVLMKDELIDDISNPFFTQNALYMKAILSLMFSIDDCDEKIDEYLGGIEEINDDVNNNLSTITDYLLYNLHDVDTYKEKCKYLHLSPKK